jgi:AraC-like DNA-binding protein
MYLLAEDRELRARRCVCALGARSPVSHGAFRRAEIVVITAGAFHARSSAGAALVGAGGLVLGNAAAGYEFRHVDDGGDRSVVFDYDPAVMDELEQGRFRAPAVPASPASVAAVALVEHALRLGDREALRQAALAVATLAVDADAARTAPPSSAQHRRIARALRYIEAHSADDCSLETLAATAGVTRYHFLRLFRAITGQTPRQHVIATRLRAAATALRITRAPVTRIALEAGFGDAAHFATAFTAAFGRSPRAFRADAPYSRRWTSIT